MKAFNKKGCPYRLLGYNMSERKGVKMEKLKPISIRETTFLKLRQAILDGFYKPGEKLTESKVAEMFGVSRTPIREALHRLESEDLVKIHPRKYCEVIGITKNCIREINLIRQQLEPLAGKIAAENITDDQLDYLEKLLDLAEFHYSKKDSESLIKVHDEFHKKIINISDMNKLINILENIHDYIVSFRRSFLTRENLAERSLREHREIYNALRERDSDKVYEIYSQHLSGISEYEDVVLDDLKQK